MRHAIVATIAAAVMFLVPVRAQDVKLPSQLAFVGYDTGSAAFNMIVAIGQAFKNAYGTDLRIIAASNDVARFAPIRAGRAHVATPGVGVYFAQEGVDEFGDKKWGPQKLRRVMSSFAPSSQATLIAKNVGARSLADVKGKRVAWVIGSPSINRSMTAQLAFAGLTWDDVKKVEFSGYIAALNGIINDQVDVAFANTSTGKVREIEVSPRGIFWPTLPHNDEAGWARMLKVAPYFIKAFGTEGAGVSKERPLEAGNYLQPSIVAYDTLDVDLVYNLTKGIILQFDKYKDIAPGADGFGLDRVLTDWVVPFHAGSVKALKEFGKWDDAAQKHNVELLHRQDVLAQAWAKMEDRKSLPDREFSAAWQQTRVESLRAVGMDPVMESWD